MDGPAKPAAIERRSEKRQFIGHYLVKLDVGKARSPLTCFVWDISERGARLKLSERIDLVGVVYVIIGSVRVCARVIWQKADQVGLEFLPDHVEGMSPQP
jgi:PilZ domain